MSAGEGDRIIFDPVSRSYIRVSLYVPQKGSSAGNTIIRFATPAGCYFGSFIVEPVFKLQHAEHDDLIGMFRCIAHL